MQNAKNGKFRGAWVAQLVKCLTSAQVMISQFVSSSCADSSEPGTCFGFCVSFSLCPSLVCTLTLTLSLSLSLKNEKKKY